MKGMTLINTCHINFINVRIVIKIRTICGNLNDRMQSNH